MTKSQIAELKPCPFCGSRLIKLVVVRQFPVPYCRGCGATIDTMFETEEGTRRWNSRIEAEQGEGGLREMARIIESQVNAHALKMPKKDRNKLKDRLFSALSSSNPTPDKAVEPLEELAKRKGYDFCIGHDGRTGFDYFSQCFEPGYMDEEPTFHCNAPTYALAEAKARAYLESLEDKGGVK